MANNNPEECEEICSLCEGDIRFHKSSCLELCKEDRSMRGEVLSEIAQCIEASACDETLAHDEASVLYHQCRSEIEISVPSEAESWCSENYQETSECLGVFTVDECKNLAREIPLAAMVELQVCTEEEVSCGEKRACLETTLRSLGGFRVFLDLRFYP